MRSKTWIFSPASYQILYRPGSELSFIFSQVEFRCEKVHTLAKGINRYPHTSVEPLVPSEIIVVGGNSYANPYEFADSAIIDTVS